MTGASESISLDLELYGAKTGNCLRAAIGLSEAGLQYRVHQIDLRREEQRSQAHLALNPAGKVPVLVARRAPSAPPLVITQSSAILFYADEQAPGRLLPPRGSTGRIKALEAFFYFASDVIAANGAAFNLLQQGQAQAADLLTQRCLSAAAASERFISEAGFMGGDSFSIADIAGFTIISAVARNLSWEQLPRLAAWRDRIGRRPAIREGMNAFDQREDGAALAADGHILPSTNATPRSLK